MANKKRIATTLGAMALTAALAIGGTLAYLSNVTETKTNTFSSSKDIHTTIKEEDFDPEKAENYTPGQVIAKTPTLTNDSEVSKDAIWVAAVVDYTNGVASMTAEEFAQYATVNGLPGENWQKVATAKDGKELYVYQVSLAHGTTTNGIFKSITVNAGIKEVKTFGTTGKIVYKYEDGKLVDVKDDTAYVEGTKYYDADGKELPIESAEDLKASLPTFEVKVTGFAVQGDMNGDGSVAADDLAPATTELTKLANTTLNVTFE